MCERSPLTPAPLSQLLGMCCLRALLSAYGGLHSSAFRGERNRGSRWKQGREGGRSLVLPEYSNLVGTTVTKIFSTGPGGDVWSFP